MQVTENTNEWINWIEESVSKEYYRFYERAHFSNIQIVGTGRFGKVYRANWKNSGKYLALRSFFNLDDVTAKEVVHELKIHRDIQFHNNIIKFHGIAKFDPACAVSCLHNEGVVHRDLHSSNGLREKPIPNTPDDYIKVYTDCWSGEPVNRPTINQVVERLKTIIEKSNVTTTIDTSTNIDNSLHGELSQVNQTFDKINISEKELGIETEIDEKKAFDLFISVSEQNHTLTQYYVGLCYEFGRGTCNLLINTVENKEEFV
ncbi:unnamed protein product [Rhizophagus irregularis]|uniref:Protein kinase domain-containing protein n=1 Tax=Rhizophagus irregularis TaxID=588596 RepID=A0A915ZZA4_9GLOM|nr:unnamed protein product [Rhizophagus irregularis]CAB5392894.1 unnamed protein product [Rhizophagus irregularis]